MCLCSFCITHSLYMSLEQQEHRGNAQLNARICIFFSVLFFHVCVSKGDL